MPKISLRRIIKASSLFLILTGAIVLLRMLEPTTDFYSRIVDDYIVSRGSVGIVLYMLAAAVLVCAGVPRHLISFAGGYAFGSFFGTVWATLGVTLGAVLLFTYSRFIGQQFIQAKFGRRIAGLERFLARAPFSMTFVIRSLPVGSNLLTNIAAGVTRIPALPFFAGSCIGYIPQNFVFAMLGSGVRLDPVWTTAISAAVYFASALLGIRLYRKYKKDVDAMNGDGQPHSA